MHLQRVWQFDHMTLRPCMRERNAALRPKRDFDHRALASRAIPPATLRATPQIGCGALARDLVVCPATQLGLGQKSGFVRH